jgi:hypothetical protein
MAERKFKILNAKGEEVGEQTLDERFTPILQPGQRAELVLTKEEAKAVAAAEKAAAKEGSAAEKAGGPAG